MYLLITDKKSKSKNYVRCKNSSLLNATLLLYTSQMEFHNCHSHVAFLLFIENMALKRVRNSCSSTCLHSLILKGKCFYRFFVCMHLMATTK